MHLFHSVMLVLKHSTIVFDVRLNVAEGDTFDNTDSKLIGLLFEFSFYQVANSLYAWFFPACGEMFCTIHYIVYVQ